MKQAVFGVCVWLGSVEGHHHLGGLLGAVGDVVAPLLSGVADYEPEEGTHESAVPPVYEGWQGPIPTLDHWHGTDAVDHQDVDYERPACPVANCEVYRFANGDICRCAKLTSPHGCKEKRSKHRNSPKCLRSSSPKHTEIECPTDCISWTTPTCQICSCHKDQAYCSPGGPDSAECAFMCLAESWPEVQSNFFESNSSRHHERWEQESHDRNDHWEYESSSTHSSRSTSKYKSMRQEIKEKCPELAVSREDQAAPPVTPAPTTSAPEPPQAPVTPAPVTTDPVTTDPVTPAPATPAPATSVPEAPQSSATEVQRTALATETAASQTDASSSSAAITTTTVPAPAAELLADEPAEADEDALRTESAEAGDDSKWTTLFDRDAEAERLRREGREDYVRRRHNDSQDGYSTHNSSENYRTLPNGTIVHETVEEWIDYEESIEHDDEYQRHRRSHHQESNASGVRDKVSS